MPGPRHQGRLVVPGTPMTLPHLVGRKHCHGPDITHQLWQASLPRPKRRNSNSGRHGCLCSNAKARYEGAKYTFAAFATIHVCCRGNIVVASFLRILPSRLCYLVTAAQCLSVRRQVSQERGPARGRRHRSKRQSRWCGCTTPGQRRCCAPGALGHTVRVLGADVSLGLCDLFILLPFAVCLQLCCQMQLHTGLATNA